VTSSSQDKPLPTQKPLPPLPADKTHSKRKKIARFFGLHKKKNEDEEDEEDGIDFSDVFDNPIYRPGELKEDGHEPLTALPHMSDPNQPRASGETGATGRETVEEKKWTLRKMASRRFYEE
jgi:hypothetical protein